METANRRISERELIIPALLVIKDNPKITTTDLIKALELIFKPSGKDIERAKNRKDTYFSQKVRNIKSHDTVSPYVNYSKNSWELNSEGYKFLEENKNLVESYQSLIFDVTYKINDVLAASDILSKRVRKNASTKHKPIIIDENEIISDGGKNKVVKISVVKERSSKLRKAAIEYYKDDNGKIKCSICGFEFTEHYGDYGKNFIEIHHIKPICQYEDEDINKTIKDALENLVPLCPNCHRMIHKASELTYKEFEKYYAEINKKEN